MYNDDFAHSDVQISFMQILSAALVFIVVFIIPAGWIESQRQNFDSGPAPYTADALAERQQQSGSSNQNQDVNADSEGGQVAGETTAPSLTTGTTNNAGKLRIPFTAYYIDMQSNAGLLTIGGIALFGVGISLVGFVIFSDKEPQRQQKLSNYELGNLDRWS